MPKSKRNPRRRQAWIRLVALRLRGLRISNSRLYRLAAWATILALVTIPISIAGIILAARQEKPTLTPSSPSRNTPTEIITSEGLQVSKFAVEDTREIPVQIFDVDQPVGKGSLQALVVSLAVKNVSRVPAVLTSAEFRIDRAEEFAPGCKEQGGPLNYSAVYDVRVPAKPLRLPWVAKREVWHEIKPNRVEKIGFTLGPQTFGEGGRPWIYQFDLLLHHDLSSKPLAVGSGIIVAALDNYTITRESLQADIFPLRSWDEAKGAFSVDCAVRDARQLDSFLRLGGAQPAALSELSDRIHPFLESDMPSINDACWPNPSAGPSQTPSALRLCSTYDRARLTVRIVGRRLPILRNGEAGLEIEIAAGGKEHKVAIGKVNDNVAACLLGVAEPFPLDESKLGKCSDSGGMRYFASWTKTLAVLKIDSETIGVHPMLTLRTISLCGRSTPSAIATCTESNVMAQVQRGRVHPETR